MNAGTAIALVLALASTTLDEHRLPARARRGGGSAVRSRCAARCTRCACCSPTAAGCCGFAHGDRAASLLYVAALALALARARPEHRRRWDRRARLRLGPAERPAARRARELAGVIVSVLGLLALGVSLAGGSGEGGGARPGRSCSGSAPRRRSRSSSCSLGRAFAGGRRRRRASPAGSSSRSATSRRSSRRRAARASPSSLTLSLGYTLGTSLLQLGYQRGAALTVAGLATLLTNALPIAAGTIVLDEPVPSGAFGALRVLAFAAVTVGAVLLARPRQDTER